MYRKICYYLDEVEKPGVMPICVEIDPSNVCQNNCYFCMFADYRKENNVHLKFTEYVKLIHNLKDIGVKSITFTGGGEPTMNPDFIDMVKLAHMYGFELGLITNGIKLDELDDIFGLFRFVRVGIDAGCKETYKIIKGTDYFDKVINNIKEASSVANFYGVTLGVSFVVCEENKDEVVMINDIIGDYVDYVQVKPENHTASIVDGMEGDKVVTITDRYIPDSRIPCDIAGLVGIVGATGDVYYCCQKRGDKEYTLGNIYNNNFQSIWDKRYKINPRISECEPCRYMNYAKEYEKFKDKKYSYLRHKYFL